MIPGFNHSVRHRGTVYHVQTEDLGLQNALVSTHLFLGGTVLASRRTSYADFAQSADAGARVRKLMQEQHKEMLRQLVRGAFDREIAAVAGRAYQPGELAGATPVPPAGATPVPRAGATPVPRAAPAPVRAAPPAAAAARRRPGAPGAEEPPVLSRVPKPTPAPVVIPEIDDEDLLSDRRLDEVILAYLADAGMKRG